MSKVNAMNKPAAFFLQYLNKSGITHKTKQAVF